jgi:hypothetical protein
MFTKIIGAAVAIISVLGAMLYKIVYKARNSEHDNEHNKGIHG